MKLYGAPYPAPNPRRVRIFLAEKGIDLAETPVDLATRGHKSPEYLARNSLGQVPTLELDDGTCISETVSICRYFEEIKPDPPMFGTGAVGKAIVDMWIRRVELRVMSPVGGYWVHAHPYTASIPNRFEAYGESNRAVYAGVQKWLDREMADGRPFVAGDTYTMADICLQSTVDFAKWIELPLDAENTHLTAWHQRVTARPSARA